VGLLWIGIVNVIGANQASNLAANYGYLADAGQKVTVPAILRGAITHPSRVTHVLSQRWQALLFELAPTGTVGLLTPWGLFLFLGLLVPAALTVSPAYSSSTGGAFQNLPAMPFIFIGSVMVLTALATSPAPTWATVRKLGPRLAVVLTVAATAIVVVQGATMLRRIPDDWLLVTNAEASTLSAAQAVIPHDAEVIASYGVMGRFAERRYILTLAAAPQTFQVSEPDVYFVITPTLGDEPLDRLDADADIRYIRSHLGAKQVVDRDGVTVLEWSPPPQLRSLVLKGRGIHHAS
jgi:hypothetical protein